MAARACFTDLSGSVYLAPRITRHLARARVEVGLTPSHPAEDLMSKHRSTPRLAKAAPARHPVRDRAARSPRRAGGRAEAQVRPGLAEAVAEQVEAWRHDWPGRGQGRQRVGLNCPGDLAILELQAELNPPIADCCVRPPR